MHFTTYQIGRDEGCDICIRHPTIGRWHAELVGTPQGHWFLTDRASKNGTFLKRAGAWKRIRQDFVDPREIIRFAGLELSLATARASREVILSRRLGRLLGGAPAEEEGLSGPVKRNPETGAPMVREPQS
ncbi:MAG: FHA domain-containing protein [Pseudomonadota bacterium]